jgi:hypothetical protein
MAIWSMLRPVWDILFLFGIFFPFWYVVPRKIWQPWFAASPDLHGYNQGDQMDL